MVKKKPSGGKKGGASARILGIFGLITAIVFMPTAILLFFGMLPTMAAGLMDRTGKGTKGLTVGAMNFAGCMPFLLDLWMKGHTPENSINMIASPKTIIVIYCAAGIGYLIDWAIGGIARTMMIQRTRIRLKEIEKIKADLATRWGREVTGEIPLDAYGFPLDKSEKEDSGRSS